MPRRCQCRVVMNMAMCLVRGAEPPRIACQAASCFHGRGLPAGIGYGRSGYDLLPGLPWPRCLCFHQCARDSSCGSDSFQAVGGGLKAAETTALMPFALEGTDQSQGFLGTYVHYSAASAPSGGSAPQGRRGAQRQQPTEVRLSLERTRFSRRSRRAEALQALDETRCVTGLGGTMIKAKSCFPNWGPEGTVCVTEELWTLECRLPDAEDAPRCHGAPWNSVTTKTSPPSSSVFRGCRRVWSSTDWP